MKIMRHRPRRIMIGGDTECHVGQMLTLTTPDMKQEEYVITEITEYQKHKVLHVSPADGKTFGQTLTALIVWLLVCLSIAGNILYLQHFMNHH